MENARKMPERWFRELTLEQLRQIAVQEEYDLDMDPSWGKEEVSSCLCEWMELPTFWREQEERKAWLAECELQREQDDRDRELRLAESKVRMEKCRMEHELWLAEHGLHFIHFIYFI